MARLVFKVMNVRMGSNTQFLRLKEDRQPKEMGEGEEFAINNFYVAYKAKLAFKQISTVNVMDSLSHHQT